MKRLLAALVAALFLAFSPAESGSHHGFYRPSAFASDIASYGWDATVGLPALYAADTGTLWLSWEGYQPVAGTLQRVVEVATFACGNVACSTGTWNPGSCSPANTIAGTRKLSDPTDIHGVPDMARDTARGRNYLLYGAHVATDAKLTFNTVANNSCSWNDTTTFAVSTYGKITFPRGYVIGASFYMSYATSGLPSNQTGDESALAITSAAINADGSLTQSNTFTRIVDFTTAQNNGWVLPGSSYVSGTKIVTLASYGAFIGHYPVSNIYWVAYDTATGAASNFDGSVTVAAGSLPLSKATLDASFVIYADAALPGCIPNAVIDDAGATHVVTCTGDSSTVAQYIEINNSGSGWSSPHVIKTFAAPLLSPANITVAKAANGGIAAYWPDYTSADTSYAIGAGNMWESYRASNGTWAANAQILPYLPGYAFNNPAKIADGPSGARVIFTQVSPDGTTVIGNLLGRIFSDVTGFLAR